MKNKKALKKVLLAARAVDMVAVSKYLGDEFEVVICFTLEQAKEKLTDDIGLIVCGVRFDSGNMFELLSAARDNFRTSLVPFYLIVSEDMKYSYAILEGIRRAAKVRGVSGFINLSRLVYDLGIEAACQRIRKGIRRILDSTEYQSTTHFQSFPDSMIGRQYR